MCYEGLYVHTNEAKKGECMQAIVLGATGATGRDLLSVLLQDTFFTAVHVFARRHPGITHNKLVIHIIDFDDPTSWRDNVEGDVLFSCLGTSKKEAGSKEEQWKVDYVYQYEFAKIARTNGVWAYMLVSSSMANKNSSFFYLRMKGELEDAVRKIGFSFIQIFHPPLLERKQHRRLSETIFIQALRGMHAFGLGKQLRTMPTEVLALSMVEKFKAHVIESYGAEWHSKK